MKINVISARRFAAMVPMLAILGATTPSVQAQTFTGKPDLTQQPNTLRTIITPVANSSILRVRYENDGYGTVRIVLRDERGTIVYEELQPKRKYSGQLDLTSLPNGAYTLVLQTPQSRHTEHIHVNTPTSEHIVLITPKLAEPVAERVSQH
jgi:hypothetical protein